MGKIRNMLSTRLVGDETPIRSLDGDLWLRPRKFSVMEQDEINRLTSMQTKDLSMPKLARVARRMALEDPDKAMSEQDILNAMTDEELEVLLKTQTLEESKVMEYKIVHGIAEHNFCDNGTSSIVDKAIVEDILSYPPLANEVVGIIDEFNGRPLAQKPSKTSKM